MKTNSERLVMLLGLGFMLLGLSYLAGLQTLPLEAGPSCKSVCGLGLLFSQFFGPRAGGFVVGALWMGIGGAVGWFVWRKSLQAIE
jgi:hypothetical protein